MTHETHAMKIRLLILALLLGGFNLVAQDIEAPIFQFKAGYQIQGTVIKKHFLGDRKISITWNDGSSLNGMLEYDGFTALVKGEYNNTIESIIGTFAVHNTKKGELSAKSNLPLTWNVKDLLHYSIQRSDDQVELIREKDKIQVDLSPLTDDSVVTSITANIAQDVFDKYGYNTVDSLILYSQNVRIAYDEGQVFEGKAAFTNGYFLPVPVAGRLLEHPLVNVREIFFDRTKSQEYNVQIALKENKLVNTLDFYVSPSDIPEEGTQIADAILTQAVQASGKAALTHGRTFEGNFSLRKNINQLDVQLQNGTVSFGNGDIFSGNVGGKWIGNIPVEGTLSFSDGSSKQGNWLSAYKLSDLDFQELANSFTPSEYLEEASEMSSHNNKIKTFSGRIAEGPFGYYYSGRPLEIEEGSGKYAYYLESGDRVLHGAYSFKLNTYMTSAGKDLISVSGQNYNGVRSGDWQLVHKGGDGTTKADVKEHYMGGNLEGPFTYIFTIDGMKYTIKGNYVNNLMAGDVTITFREGPSGFDLKGTFDANGWADGKWSLIDRRDRQETVYIFNHGNLTSKSGPSKVSVQGIFNDPYEPMSQYKKIKNGFR